MNQILPFKVVDLPGFEPRKTAPKTVVLPLHHRSILNCDAKLIFLILQRKSITKNIFIFFIELVPHGVILPKLPLSLITYAFAFGY